MLFDLFFRDNENYCIRAAIKASSHRTVNISGICTYVCWTRKSQLVRIAMAGYEQCLSGMLPVLGKGLMYYVQRIISIFVHLSVKIIQTDHVWLASFFFTSAYVVDVKVNLLYQSIYVMNIQ